MKIVSNKTYDDYITTLMRLSARIDELTKENKKLKNDIRCLKNINSRFSDVIFPNTDERGLGDSETPDNFSEKYF